MLGRCMRGVLCAGLVLGCATVAQADDSTLDTILKERELTVGYISYDVLTYRNDDGDITGFFPRLLEKIAGQMNIPPENINYVATSWSDFATGLNTGKYDFTIAGLFSTIPRATSAAFTDPIFYLGNSAMAKTGDERFQDIDNVMELDKEEYKIAVVSGEQSHEFVKQHFENAQIEVVDSSDLTAALLQVTSGRADVAMSDHFVVQKFVAKQGGVVDLFADSPYNMKPITWAVRHQDQALLTFLNNAIEYMASTGELQELMRDSEYDVVPFIRQKRELHKVN